MVLDNTEKQVITIVDRKVFSMGGVDDIRGFDEEGVVLETRLGRIHVEGRELKIESLAKEGGNILISGEIDAVYYTESFGKKKGFFSK